MKKSNLNNQSGFTLIEVMVVASMMGGLALVGMQMTKNMSRDQKNMFQKSEMLSLIQNIEKAVNNETACTKSFIGKTTQAGTQNLPEVFGVPAGSSVAKPGVDYGLGTGVVRVKSMEFTGFAPGTGTLTGKTPATEKGQGILTVVLTKGTGIGTSDAAQKSSSIGALTEKKTYTIFLESQTGTGLIVGCSADATQYATVTCTALNGTYNAGTGKCDNISIANTNGNPAIAATDGEILHKFGGTDRVRIGRAFPGGYYGISIVNQPDPTAGGAAIGAAEGDEVATKKWIRERIYDELFTTYGGKDAEVPTITGTGVGVNPTPNATLDMVRRGVCASISTTNEDGTTTTSAGTMAPAAGSPCVITPRYCTTVGNTCIAALKTMSAAAFDGGTLNLTGNADINGALVVQQDSQFVGNLTIGAGAVVINSNGTITAASSISSAGNISASFAISAGTQVSAGSQVCVSGNCNTTFGAHHCDFVGPIRDKMVGYVAGRVECQTSPGNVIYYR